MKLRHAIKLGCAWLAACSSTPAQDDGGAVDAATDVAQDNFVGPSDAGADGKPLGAPRLYVGSGDGNIRIFAFDDQAATLTPIATVAAGGNPSFLAFDPARQFMYAVDEVASQVGAFAIDPQTGKLTALGAVSSLGNGPAHVSVDRAGKLVMVANYGGGTIAVFPRLPDGRLGDASATHSFGANALTHEIVTDPTNAFVLVPNKGLSIVEVFRLDGGSLGDLGPTPAGSGARHVAFDSPGTHAYVIDETGSTITAFTFDPQSGALGSIQTISSRIDASVGTNTGAEIQVTNDGKHVIASNRGDDTLTVFDVDSQHMLAPTARVSSGGNTPRDFQIEETGRFLFVANQTSGSVITMKMDAQTGIPSPVGTALLVPSPAFVGLIYLP